MQIVPLTQYAQDYEAQEKLINALSRYLQMTGACPQGVHRLIVYTPNVSPEQVGRVEALDGTAIEINRATLEAFGNWMTSGQPDFTAHPTRCAYCGSDREAGRTLCPRCGGPR